MVAAARLLPPSLISIIDTGFAFSHLLVDEYVFRVAIVVQAQAEAGVVVAACAREGLQREAVAGAEMLEQIAIAGRDAPSAKRGVRDEQPNGSRVHAMSSARSNQSTEEGLSITHRSAAARSRTAVGRGS